MLMRWLAVAALATLPPFAYVVGATDSNRHYPPRQIVSTNTNVRVEILVEGSPTPVYRDGKYRWIEGRRGDRFSFRLTNLNSFPVGVILSADGQSLTADGAASSSNPAYVIEAGGSETISVWREDLSGGRELVFTSVDRSLAAMKGDRRNIGVLGALVWQLEDREPPRPVPMDRDKAPAGARRSDDASKESQAAGIGVGAGNRVDDRAYLTDRYRRVRMLGSEAIYYDDRDGLLRAGVDLGQYREIEPADRRRSDPFPDGGYRGVRIP